MYIVVIVITYDDEQAKGPVLFDRGDDTVFEFCCANIAPAAF